jgi:diguanylate cyclase (GGDEF)-like protein
MTSRSGNASPGIAEKKTNAGRSQEIHEHIGTLSGRDLQLFSISLLLLLVMAAGIVAVVYPNLMVGPKSFQTEVRLLPQLFFGLVTLIILFSAYIIVQKRELGATHRRLVEELIFNERIEAVSLIDSTTQLFNRRAMEQMLAHEVARANRLGSPLSMLILDICEFEVISSRLGTLEIERFLYKSAQLVKNTFRGSDLVFRYKETQFLIIIPDTHEQHVDFALKRLEAEVSRHNSEFRSQAELAFSYGTAEFVQGSRITDTLLTAERKAFLHKNQFAQVF